MEMQLTACANRLLNVDRPRYYRNQRGMIEMAPDCRSRWVPGCLKSLLLVDGRTKRALLDAAAPPCADTLERSATLKHFRVAAYNKGSSQPSSPGSLDLLWLMTQFYRRRAETDASTIRYLKVPSGQAGKSILRSAERVVLLQMLFRQDSAADSREGTGSGKLKYLRYSTKVSTFAMISGAGSAR